MPRAVQPIVRTTSSKSCHVGCQWATICPHWTFHRVGRRCDKTPVTYDLEKRTNIIQQIPLIRLSEHPHPRSGDEFQKS